MEKCQAVEGKNYIKTSENFRKTISEKQIFQSQVRKYFKLVFLTRKEIKKLKIIRNGNGKFQSKKSWRKRISVKNKKEREGLNPMDKFEFKTQYVSGMANVNTCEESLYHRL